MHLSFWMDHFLDSRSEIHQIFALLLKNWSHSEINWPLVNLAHQIQQPFPKYLTTIPICWFFFVKKQYGWWHSGFIVSELVVGSGEQHTEA